MHINYGDTQYENTGYPCMTAENVMMQLAITHDRVKRGRPGGRDSGQA